MTISAFSGRFRPIVGPASALAILAGILVSYRSAIAAWRVESDVALPFIIWQGIREHGFGFINSFGFTPDNWLLFPLPLFLTLFAIGAGSATVVILTGWLIFLACVLLAFLIVRRVAGTHPATLAAIVLLLSNRNALGGMGFLTYPVTHNASLLGGLTAVYAAMRWVETPARRWLFLSALTLLATSISDPWTVAAFDVPLAAATAFMLIRRGVAPRYKILLRLLVTIAAVIVAYQVAFALLKPLRSQPIVLASREQISNGVASVTRFCAMWFNFVPGADLPYRSSPGRAAVVVDLVLIASIVGLTATLAVRRLGRRPALDLLTITGFTSVVLTAFAYVVLDTPKGLETGRYFMASYFFLVMLFVAVAASSWNGLPLIGKVVVSFCGLLMSAAGLTSGLSAFISVPTSSPRPNTEVARFSAFLKSHDLRYGFGGYWEAYANAVGWETNDVIIMRPINFDDSLGRFVPRAAQTSPLWYEPNDPPSGQKTAFLAIADGEGCKAVTICIKGAVQQFGPPVAEFRHDDIDVLVYDYLLFNDQPDVIAAHMAPMPVGTDIDLTDKGKSIILNRGWSHPEPMGTWTKSDRADILFRLPAGWTGAAKVTVLASAFAPKKRTGQDVVATVRGRQIARWHVTNGQHRPYSLTVPSEIVRDAGFAIRLAIPGAISPRKAGKSRDKRQLGINVQSIRVDRAARESTPAHL